MDLKATKRAGKVIKNYVILHKCSGIFRAFMQIFH